MHHVSLLCIWNSYGPEVFYFYFFCDHSILESFYNLTAKNHKSNKLSTHLRSFWLIFLPSQKTHDYLFHFILSSVAVWKKISFFDFEIALVTINKGSWMQNYDYMLTYDLLHHFTYWLTSPTTYTDQMVLQKEKMNGWCNSKKAIFVSAYWKFIINKAIIVCGT